MGTDLISPDFYPKAGLVCVAVCFVWVTYGHVQRDMQREKERIQAKQKTTTLSKRSPIPSALVAQEPPKKSP